MIILTEHEQATRAYTHDHPADTLFSYHRDGNKAELWLSFTSEDKDMGTEEIAYNGEAGESMPELVQGLREEISSFLDRAEHHEPTIAGEIHSSDDYYGEFSRTALYAFEACLMAVEKEQGKIIAWTPLPPEKADWLYSDNTKDAQRGCIGHLRGDFGKNGKEFWTSWFDHLPKLKQSAFTDELQKVVDTLRQPNGLLHNLSSMRKQCYDGTGIQGSYGFHAESRQYEYCLRCSPRQGDYNFYLYCYDKNAQREHAMTKPSLREQLQAPSERTTTMKSNKTKEQER